VAPKQRSPQQATKSRFQRAGPKYVVAVGSTGPQAEQLRSLDSAPREQRRLRPDVMSRRRRQRRERFLLNSEFSSIVVDLAVSRCYPGVAPVFPKSAPL
jgi:hypothetical protein